MTVKTTEPEKIRLLHVIYGGKGGIGSYVLELIASDHQQRLKHRVVSYGIEGLDSEYKSFFDDHGVTWEEVRKRRGPDLLATERLALAMTSPADVLVVHTSAAAVAALVHSLASRPMIFVEHTTSESKTRRDLLWSAALRRRADRVVAFYPEQIEEFWPKPGKTERARIRVIPKSTDVGFFVPAPHSRAQATQGLRIGMQGRLAAHKDHETLLRAVAELGGDHSLHLAGDGDLLGNLQALAQELGISDRVRFHGLLSRTELRDLLQSLDIYVHATHGETLCYAIMEAQACGVPVVASRVKGVDSAILEGKTGRLYAHQDPKALATILTELASAPAQRQSLGHGGRQAMEELATHSTADAYWELIAELGL